MKIPSHLFTDNEIINLNKYRDKQGNANLKIRFVALLMISKDIAIDVIAQAIGKCNNTIINWFVKYLSKGIDSLNSYNYVSKKEFLTKVQIAEVIDWARKNNPSTCKEVARKIKDDYSVVYATESVRKFLNKKWNEILTS